MSSLVNNAHIQVAKVLKAGQKKDDDDSDALASSGTPINESLTRTRV